LNSVSVMSQLRNNRKEKNATAAETLRKNCLRIPRHADIRGSGANSASL
jgi:hypothetical protein